MRVIQLTIELSDKDEFDEQIKSRLESEADNLRAVYPQSICRYEVKALTNRLEFDGIEILTNDEVKLNRAMTILDACQHMDSAEVVDMMQEMQGFTPPDEDEELGDGDGDEDEEVELRGFADSEEDDE